MKRFSFLEAQNHSKQREEVKIFAGGYTVEVRPIAPAQIDHILPMIKRLFKTAKDVWSKKDSKETDYFDLFIDVAFCEESREDTFHLIYSVLNRPGAKIFRNVNGAREEMELFTYDDMVANSELTTLILLAKVIWKQNAQKIFSSLAKEAENVEEIPKKKEEEEKKTVPVEKAQVQASQ